MDIRTALRRIATSTLALAMVLLRVGSPGQTPGAAKLTVPRMWDDAAMATLEVPLANPVGSPIPVSAEYYYSIPVRPIYKQYAVYAPGREPAG
jgi:hypothetical protein